MIVELLKVHVKMLIEKAEMNVYIPIVIMAFPIKFKEGKKLLT